MENTALDLKLTESAVQQIKKLLSRDERTGHGLRVGVADGGCSGFSYKLDFDKEQKPDDVILELAGVSIYVDRASGTSHPAVLLFSLAALIESLTQC